MYKYALLSFGYMETLSVAQVVFTRNEYVDGQYKGQGAKYTQSRRPVKLLKSIECDSKSEALSLEASIKKKSRKEKLKIVNCYES